MYWDDTPSKIDSILQQEDVTLEKILDENDVLQECINNNVLLIKFLTKEESMIQMLTMMTNEPVDSENVMEKYKYANTICEILTYDANVFSNLIATNEKYLTILWSFLDKSCLNYNQNNNETSEQAPVETSKEKQTDDSEKTLQSDDHQKKILTKKQPPEETIEKLSSQPDILNPLLASFFAKVFLYMFTHDNEPVLEFLLSRHSPQDFVTVILNHIQASAIMDFINRAWVHVNLVDKINESSSDNIPRNPKFNNLLLENGFVEKLVEIFKHQELESEQHNASNLISNIVQVKREILVNSSPQQRQILNKFEFESEKTVRDLLSNMLKCRTKNSIVNGLKIIQTLLQYNLHVQNMINQQEAQLSSMNMIETKNQKNNYNNDDCPTSDVDGLEPMPKFLKQQITPQKNIMNETKFMQPQLQSPVGVQSEHLSHCVHNVSKALYEYLDDFVELLLDNSKSSPIKSTVGLIEEPLGLIRLEVVHLFVALFATSDFQIMKKCSQSNVLKTLTDLFFNYSLNNQLHKYYEQIIYYIFQNYHNFKIIYDKHQANNNLKETNQNESKEPEEGTNENKNNDDEKVSHFISLYEISKTLVKQILKDCHLIEKILANYSHEKVPVKSFELNNNNNTNVNNDDDDDEKQIEKKSLEIVNNNDGDDHNYDGNEGSEKVKDEDVEMEEEKVEPKNLQEIVSKESREEEETAIVKKPKLTSRPAYMGHLRLIANILKERCDEQLSKECLLEELLPQWREFLDGHLSQVNKLIESELVPETKRSTMMMNSIGESLRDEEAFLIYQMESMTGTNLPDNTKLLPSDFNGQNPLGNINEQLKLNNEIKDNEIDFDKFWDNQGSNFTNFEKYFEFSTKIEDGNNQQQQQQDDDDDDDDNPWAREDILTKTKKSLGFITEIIQEDFATFDSKDPVFQKLSEDSLDDFEDYFTNIDAFNNSTTNDINMDNSLDNQQNPWGIIESSSGNKGQTSTNKVVNDDNWANFLNDPFVSSSIDSLNHSEQLFNINNDFLNKNDEQTKQSSPSSSSNHDDVFTSNVTISCSLPNMKMTDDDSAGSSKNLIQESQE